MPRNGKGSQLGSGEVDAVAVALPLNERTVPLSGEAAKIKVTADRKTAGNLFLIMVLTPCFA